MAVRVVDEYGDPVPHVMEATPAAPRAPIAASLHGNRTAATDLRGECRISGAVHCVRLSKDHKVAMAAAIVAARAR